MLEDSLPCWAYLNSVYNALQNHLGTDSCAADSSQGLTWCHACKSSHEQGVAHAGRSVSTTPLPHHCPTPHVADMPAGKERVSPEARELIQAMDRSLVTPARSESGFPGPLALPIDISSRLLTGGVQAVCAGMSWLSALWISEPLLGAASSPGIHVAPCASRLNTPFFSDTVAANHTFQCTSFIIPGCVEPAN